jgi:hypothetical protein
VDDDVTVGSDCFVLGVFLEKKEFTKYRKTNKFVELRCPCMNKFIVASVFAEHILVEHVISISIVGSKSKGFSNLV